MGTIKWFAGLLGWVTLGPLGGILGYILGAAVERGTETLAAGAPKAGGGGHVSDGDPRSSFLFSLLVLSSAVIKADGKVHPAELRYVRDFVRQNFGEGMAEPAMQALDRLNGQTVDVRSVGGQIALNMNYSQRLQLFHYLVQIAVADGTFSASEKSVLEAIAAALRLSLKDSSSVISMFYKDSRSAYEVLEITPSASDAEVKSAFRRMAMKHHPDKVASLGPDVQKAAEEKFRRIHQAYETIKKERGL